MRHISDIAITFLFVVCMGMFNSVDAQEGLPFFRNFTVQEYNAHNRNADVVCDSSGVVYFANFEGIIYYNGAEWNKILTPGISRITRLHIDTRDQVWAGGHNYIGKLSSTPTGTPILKSYISDQNNNTIRIGEVIDIEEHDEYLTFFTQNYRIEVSDDSVISVSEYDGYALSERPDKTIKLSERLKVHSDGANGLVFTDSESRKLYSMTEANGLCSNTINQMTVDGRGSLWAATDNGVFQVMIPSFYSKFTSREGLKGEVTALYRYKQQLYAGTLNGVYLFNESLARFEQLPAISQSCWQLKESPAGVLYAVTSNGLFKINDRVATQITDDNTFSLAFGSSVLPNPSSPSNPTSGSSTFYTGEIDGVYVIQGNDKRKIADIEKTTKLEFVDNRLWAETLYGELYMFEQDLSLPVLLGQAQGLKTVGGNKFYVIGSAVNVFSSAGILSRDTGKQQFEAKQTPLDSLMQTGNWWPGLYASSPSGREEWIAGGDGKNPVVLTDGQYNHEKNRQLYPVNQYTIRVLYIEDNGVAWVGGNFGLFRFDPLQKDLSFEQKPQVFIRSVLINADSVYFAGLNSDLSKSAQYVQAPRFSHSMKNFEFAFSSGTNDVINNIQYSYYLKGYDNQWSQWQNSYRKEYTNLSYGLYTFCVKASDSFGRESEEAQFSFVILKPFYIEWYALLVYLTILILLIFLFFKWRTHKLLQEKIRLENIVEQRTRQIREQRDEITEKSQKLENTLSELGKVQNQLIRQEKAATVGKLTHGLIDRILNPLNYIINFSHLSYVLLKDLKEDITEEADKMSEDNYEDITEIMDMLNTHMTKIEEHGNNTSRILKAMEEMLSNHDCKFKYVDVNYLLNSNLTVLREYYKKEIETSVIDISFIPLSESLDVAADQIMLGKALMSMMQNCIHALHKKKTKSDFQAAMTVRIEKNVDKAIIYLRDNGIGIEQSIINKIFDPFFTTKTTSEAAGVGLYLSREIILSHNGSIEVSSKQGEYTEFIISIPIHQTIKSEDNG